MSRALPLLLGALSCSTPKETAFGGGGAALDDSDTGPTSLDGDDTGSPLGHLPFDWQESAPELQPWNPSSGRFWVLVHPTGLGPSGPGIYGFEGVEPVDYIALSGEEASPNALAFDGSTFYVGGGYGHLERIRADGTLLGVDDLSVQAEGIVLDGEAMLLGAWTHLSRVEGTTLTATYSDDFGVINDLVRVGDALYYAQNDETDKVIAADLDSSVPNVTLIDRAVDDQLLYALAWDGEHLVTVDQRADAPYLLFYDLDGTRTDEVALDFPATAWITGLVFAPR